MFKHILIPTNGSRLANRAVRQGLQFAKTQHARVTLFYASPSYWVVSAGGSMRPNETELFTRFVKEYEVRSKGRIAQQRTVQAMRILQPSLALARKMRVECDSLHVVSDLPFDAILSAARSRKCDLILMASHGWGGVKGLVLGSETTKVLTHSKIPVLVLR